MSDKNIYPHIFEPITLRGITFKNRVMAAPVGLGPGSCPGGIPSEACLDEYETRARGGVSAVTVADIRADGQEGIELSGGEPCHRQRLLLLTEGIRCHGAIPSAELNHTGSGIDINEMTAAEMKAAAELFARRAVSAVEAGFQMITLQGAHGRLLGRFLSPLTNRRTDRFGGSLENRARFPLMVLRAVRAAAGERILIEYRLSASERIIGGLESAEAAEFCRLIQRDADIIHVTSGLYDAPIRTGAVTSMYHPHGSDLHLAGVIRESVQIPVAVSGGFNDPKQIEQALASGWCDFVALGRQMLADPDFVKKTAGGREAEIAPCLRCPCYDCGGAQKSGEGLFTCAVNPAALRNMRMRLTPPPERSRKVLVIGGGPGGMYAAVTAARRGHTVRLAEKSDRLGGMLRFAEDSDYKTDLRRFRDCLEARCAAAGVEIALNTIVTGSYIEKFEPDAVIAAIGAEPSVPPIPGLAVFAHHALWAYRNPNKVGRRVIIIGSGLTGIECAMHLAEKYDCHVTVLGRSLTYAADAGPGLREALETFMSENITVKGGVLVTSVRPGGVSYRARNGRTVELDGDTVLYAVGMHSKTAEVYQLLSAHPNIRVVGDCREPGRVSDAVRDGMYAALDIT